MESFTRLMLVSGPDVELRTILTFGQLCVLPDLTYPTVLPTR